MFASNTALHEPSDADRQGPVAGFRALTWVLGVAVLLESVLFTVLTPLLPELQDELGLSRTMVGVLAAATPVGFLLGAVPTARLADRIGGKRLIVLAFAVFIPVTFAFPYAGAVLPMLALRFMQGVAGSAVWTGAFSWATAASPPDHRGRALGVVLGLSSVGAVAGPAVGALAERTSLMLVFGGLAVAATAFMVVVMVLPAARGASITGTRWRGHGRRIASCLWLVLLPSAAWGMMASLMPLRLDALGIGALAIGSAFAVGGLLEAVSSPLAGRIVDRAGIEGLTRWSLIGSVVMLIVLAPTFADWLLIAGVIVVGALLGFFWVPSAYRMHGLSTDGIVSDGMSYALVNIGLAGGVAAGTLVGAGLADIAGYATPFAVMAVLMAATAVFGRRA